MTPTNDSKCETNRSRHYFHFSCPAETPLTWVLLTEVRWQGDAKCDLRFVCGICDPSEAFLGTSGSLTRLIPAIANCEVRSTIALHVVFCDPSEAFWACQPPHSRNCKLRSALCDCIACVICDPSEAFWACLAVLPDSFSQLRTARRCGIFS
jgi:hypothetical protein